MMIIIWTHIRSLPFSNPQFHKTGTIEQALEITVSSALFDAGLDGRWGMAVGFVEEKQLMAWGSKLRQQLTVWDSLSGSNRWRDEGRGSLGLMDMFNLINVPKVLIIYNNTKK
ncbi:unnamed protein product [Cuscuta epithymum]|uniref:Uncharacterized protein n=1 Tax=Cuscuta epithymum TaxID=186058 RepID=A0AAV0GK58_9ASTE|nr:unnamed protein product [Cuscuta epithymum]CAH9148296.1 unnamed protein product [Cuscuta epithymum]